MTSAHHISNSTDVIPNLTDVSQASRRTSRISAARYGVLRYQVAMWGSVACAEGSSEQLSRLPSGQEGRAMPLNPYSRRYTCTLQHGAAP